MGAFIVNYLVRKDLTGKKKMMFEQRHEYERHWIWLHVSMLTVSIYHERVFHCILLAQEKFKIQVWSTASTQCIWLLDYLVKTKIISGTNINLGSSASRKSCSPLWLIRGFLGPTSGQGLRSSMSESPDLLHGHVISVVWKSARFDSFQCLWNTASSRKRKKHPNNIRLILLPLYLNALLTKTETQILIMCTSVQLCEFPIMIQNGKFTI